MNLKGLIKSKGFVITVAFIILALLGVAYAQGSEVTNEPEVNWVSHTEYWRNDSASTIVRLTDYRGEPYPIDQCSVTILEPDKTTFVQDAPMQESNIDGNWYHQADLQGQPLGTYEQQVTCTTTGGQTIETSNSFHLNPALEQIDTLSQQTTALNISLANVTADLSGQVADTNETIQQRIQLLDTDMTSLVSDVNSSLNTELTATEQQLVDNLSQAEMEITATIGDTQETLQTDLDAVNTSLTSLLQQTETDLSTQLDETLSNLTEQLDSLSQQTAALNVSLVNTTAQLNGKVADTNESIQQRLQVLDTDMTTLVSDVNSSLNTELTATEQQLVDNLSQAEMEITTTVSNTGQNLQTDLEAVNTSVTSLLQQTETDLSTQLDDALSNLTEQLQTVHNETQWLTNNAMNQEDRADIMTRFDTLDSNLSDALQYCDETTNSSPLCQELHNVSNAVDQYNEEQMAYLNSINQTTYNTWELLSGDIKTNVDSMLVTLNVIEARTAEINQTTNEILDEMRNDVNARIIT